MKKFKKAMEITTNVISENQEAFIEDLFTKIFIALDERNLANYYAIITKLMIETRNHLRRSNDL